MLVYLPNPRIISEHRSDSLLFHRYHLTTRHLFLISARTKTPVQAKSGYRNPKSETNSNIGLTPLSRQNLRVYLVHCYLIVLEGVNGRNQ